MNNAVLVRTSTGPEGTFGELLIGDERWPTVERPWSNNADWISCIPCGTYLLRDWNSPKFGWTLRFDLVPGRDNILVHPANRASELQGCIAPGCHVGEMGGVKAVLASRLAMSQIQAAVAPITGILTEPVVLTVVSACGEAFVVR